MKFRSKTIAKIGLSAGATILALSPIFASAENNNRTASSTATSTRPLKGSIEELREKMKEQASTTKANIQEKKQEIKSNIDEKKIELQNQFKDRLSSFLDIIFDRYNAAISRLEDISGRIDSRIAKLEAEGIDESKAKALLVTANTKLDAAKLAITNMQTTASSTIATTTDLKITYPGIKLAVQAAKEAIKAAQQALVEVVKNIKPGRNNGDEHASSTPVTATSTATTTATTTP